MCGAERSHFLMDFNHLRYEMKVKIQSIMRSSHYLNCHSKPYYVYFVPSDHWVLEFFKYVEPLQSYQNRPSWGSWGSCPRWGGLLFGRFAPKYVIGGITLFEKSSILFV